MKSTGLRAGEETARAIWKKKITSRTGDLTGKARGKAEDVGMYFHCQMGLS